MSLKQKKAVSDACEDLQAAIGYMPPASHREKATRALQTMTRVIGELRRERAVMKSELESKPALPTKEQLDASRQAVNDLKLELDRVSQKLRTSEGALKSQTLAETSQARLGRLVKGPDQPKTTAKGEKLRREQLHRLLPKYLPDIVKVIRTDNIDVLTIHQDAFASSFHADEYTLLGMSVKYAGEFGMAVSFSGTNGETCGSDSCEAQVHKQKQLCRENTPVARQSEPARKRSWLHRILFGPKAGK